MASELPGQRTRRALAYTVLSGLMLSVLGLTAWATVMVWNRDGAAVALAIIFIPAEAWLLGALVRWSVHQLHRREP